MVRLSRPGPRPDPDHSRLVGRSVPGADPRFRVVPGPADLSARDDAEPVRGGILPDPRPHQLPLGRGSPRPGTTPGVPRLVPLVLEGPRAACRLPPRRWRGRPRVLPGCGRLHAELLESGPVDP